MTAKKTGFLIIAAIAVVLIAYFAVTQNRTQRVQEVPVTSVQETPTTNAKINIDAVCQGALAFMSFPDSAHAEVFVAECKEGKHPEVIEQYKAQMNLGDGAAI